MGSFLIVFYYVLLNQCHLYCRFLLLLFSSKISFLFYGVHASSFTQLNARSLIGTFIFSDIGLSQGRVKSTLAFFVFLRYFVSNAKSLNVLNP